MNSAIPETLSLASSSQGLYIHIPFCSSRCSYCDFATDLESVGDREDYMRILFQEMESFAKIPLFLDSIYFGGGTPSLLGEEIIGSILEAVRSHWSLSEDIEITLEANPESITPESMSGFLAGGVNRFSVGIQSFHDRELKYLGRRHLVSQNFDAIRILSEASIRCNADLMIGIPLQTRESLGENIKSLMEFDVKHVSAYMLSIEQGAPWYEAVRSGKLPMESEEQCADLYTYFLESMDSFGFTHYEISAFSLPGEECRHNLKYWRNQDYLGIGPSAASYLGNYRFQNQRGLKKWISQIKGEESFENFEYIHSKNAILDTIMLRFRLKEGLQASRLAQWNADFPELEISQKVERLETRGLIEKQAMRYRLSNMGILFANEVFLEFLE